MNEGLAVELSETTPGLTVLHAVTAEEHIAAARTYCAEMMMERGEGLSQCLEVREATRWPECFDALHSAWSVATACGCNIDNAIDSFALIAVSGHEDYDYSLEAPPGVSKNKAVQEAAGSAA